MIFPTEAGEPQALTRAAHAKLRQLRQRRGELHPPLPGRCGISQVTMKSWGINQPSVMVGGIGIG